MGGMVGRCMQWLNRALVLKLSLQCEALEEDRRRKPSGVLLAEKSVPQSQACWGALRGSWAVGLCAGTPQSPDRRVVYAVSGASSILGNHGAGGLSQKAQALFILLEGTVCATDSASASCMLGALCLGLKPGLALLYMGSEEGAGPFLLSLLVPLCPQPGLAILWQKGVWDQVGGDLRVVGYMSWTGLPAHGGGGGGGRLHLLCYGQIASPLLAERFIDS